ncbi:hypothetical protein [Gryllotalpicola ginsengisoli]|uniref:hypothetical protein n=1 Tax=Gryllotalpicola ginsengisoli TaxID=444608 RepID=UPI0012DC7558|nr:hypothetical protein [Gryllotalpicola ginsengisoli]
MASIALTPVEVGRDGAIIAFPTSSGWPFHVRPRPTEAQARATGLPPSAASRVRPGRSGAATGKPAPPTHFIWEDLSA